MQQLHRLLADAIVLAISCGSLCVAFNGRVAFNGCVAFHGIASNQAPPAGKQGQTRACALTKHLSLSRARVGGALSVSPPPPLPCFSLSLSLCLSLSLSLSACAGIEYMHTNNLIHRDIKPENLLLSGNGQLKLADFGTSQVFPQPRHPPSFPLSLRGHRSMISVCA